MAETRTRPTRASVEAYLDSRASEAQRADCRVLMSMFRRLTRQPPKMWGPSIVGYGSYRYTYESGHSGESCLYFRRLADLDLSVLEKLVVSSIADVRRRYGKGRRA